MTKLKDECYVCEQHIISLYIWTPRIGLMYMIKDEQEINYYKERIWSLNEDLNVDVEHEIPHFAS